MRIRAEAESARQGILKRGVLMEHWSEEAHAEGGADLPANPY